MATSTWCLLALGTACWLPGLGCRQVCCCVARSDVLLHGWYRVGDAVFSAMQLC